MSREFGENRGSFFHGKLYACMEDLRGEAREDFHKKFIPLFEELYEIAWAISSVEAGDSCIDRSIMETMQRIPRMKQFIKNMEDYLTPYQRVAEEAVRKAVESKE